MAKLIKNPKKYNDTWHIQDKIHNYDATKNTPLPSMQKLKNIPAVKTHCGNNFCFHGYGVKKTSNITSNSNYTSMKMKQKDVGSDYLKRNGDIKGKICSNCMTKYVKNNSKRKINKS